MSKIKNYLNFVNEDSEYDYMGTPAEKEEDYFEGADEEDFEDGMSAEEVNSASDLRAKNAPQAYIDTPQSMQDVSNDNRADVSVAPVAPEMVAPEMAAPMAPEMAAPEAPDSRVKSFQSYVDDEGGHDEGGHEEHEHDHDGHGQEEIAIAVDEPIGDEIALGDDEEVAELEDYMESLTAGAEKSLSKDGMTGGKKEKDKNPKDNPISDTTDVQVPNVKKFGDFKDSLKAQDLSNDGNTKGKKLPGDAGDKHNPIKGKSDGKELKAKNA